VLAALAMRPGELRTPEQLADAVWNLSPPASWAKNLQGCVSRLRKQLGHAAIQTTPNGYRLVLAPDAVDAQQFERLVARARELLVLREWELARYTVTQALDLWRGPPLTELEEWGPGALEAARLVEERLGAEELQLDAALQSGHHREVLARAQAMVEEAPVRERRWSLLAVAQYQSGHQAEALRTLHRQRRMLSVELGLDPAPDAVALEEAILRQDPSLAVETALPSSSDSSPYLGLTPYDEADAELFCGRDREVEDCLARLARHGALVVVGPSGSGKSSLVRAGLAARLRLRGRGVVVVTPGRHPGDALAAPLSTTRRPVLVVDQAEDLFSVCDDAAERADFLATVSHYAESAPVIVALRADRTGDVSGHPEFARLVERGLFLLGPMSSEGLRAAIETPARSAGLVVEAGLVDLLVREVEGEPGALPLLSHTLRETWLRREGRTLTVAGYQSSGGVRGAVAQSAEGLYADLSETERALLKELLLRLVAPGREGEPVRARMPRRSLLGGDQARLVDLLVTARLVTSDDGFVELAHESVVRAWPRLRGWLEDDVEGRRLLHHLVAAAEAWESLGRPDSELYRGVRLTQALAWREAADPELTGTERDFLAAGEAAAAAEERSLAERARQQSVMIRRLRVTVGGAAVLLVLALVAGFLAVRQSESARASATAAEARRAVALSLVTDDIDESLLLAVAGVRLDDSPETRSTLLGALGRHPELVASIHTGGDTVTRLDVSPDGRSVVTHDYAHHVRLFDVESGLLRGEFQAGSPRGLSWISGDVRFSPDGETVAVPMAAPARQPVMLLDADDLTPLRTLPGGFGGKRWQVLDLTYSADGRFLAATMWRVRGSGATTRPTTSTALVWRVASPRRPVNTWRLEPYGHVPGVGLSPDGSLLYTTEPLSVHDVATGRSELLTEEFLLGVAVSPDGRFLASPTDRGIALIDPRTGEVLRRLRGSSDDGFLLRFSTDGRRIATVAFRDREALVWDVRSGRRLLQAPLGEAVEAIAFAPDGGRVYTAGSDATLRSWDVDGPGRFASQVAFPRPGGIGDIVGVAVAPGADRVAYWASDRVVFLHVRSGRLRPPIRPPEGAGQGRGSWHPDGVHYTRVAGGTVLVWDARRNRLVRESPVLEPQPVGVDHSTDGSRMAVITPSGAALLESATLDPVAPPVRLDAAACAVALGPDNRTAMVLTAPPERLWSFWNVPCTGWTLVDLEAGTVRAQGALPVEAAGVDFSPRGGQAAVRGSGGEVLVLDLDTGAPVRPPVTGHDGVVTTLTYSTDGERLVSSASDATVAIWDARTGRSLARLTTPSRFVRAGFDDDGHSVLIATEGDGPVIRWDTRISSAITFACRMAGRQLTRSEWAGWFGDRPYEETCPRD
jgi:WD40 repeat protein/DNA-binding SARP family transcriptional activator